MSDLRQNLKGIGMTQTRLAEMVGKDIGHINRIINGRYHPKPPLRDAIVTATGGAISGEELAGFSRPVHSSVPLAS